MLRSLLHRAITTPRGDFFPPIRIQKRIARRLNTLLGSPLRSTVKPRVEDAVAPEAKAEPAPVMVYYEKDRNVRERVRVEEVLKARGIPYRLLDVAGDQATIAFVVREAGCEEDDLPVVFVAGAPVGCYNELVQWDVSGRLMRAVFPE